MIAKTESGFEIELDDEAMNDVELVEAIVEMDTDGTKSVLCGGPPAWQGRQEEALRPPA